MAKKIESIYECLKSRVLLDEVADKWTILIFGLLSNGPVRFNEIKRTVQGISQKTLTQNLRKMERSGMIARRVIDGATLGVEYSLTPLGESIRVPFEGVFDWVNQYGHEVEKAKIKFDAKNEKRLVEKTSSPSKG